MKSSDLRTQRFQSLEYVRKSDDNYVRISVHLKMLDEQHFLENLFKNFGSVVNSVLLHIRHIFKEWPEIAKIEGECSECHNVKKKKDNKGNITETKSEKQSLFRKHISGAVICANCFNRKWSWQTLTLKKYIDELKENNTELGPQSNYYSSAVKLAVAVYKSYAEKLKERKREIYFLEKEIETTESPKMQEKLRKKLAQKQKGLKDVFFTGNVVYLGCGSMFGFKKVEDKYLVGICNPNVPRHKEWFELKLGNRDEYHTAHNKYKILDSCLESQDYKGVLPKIVRKENDKGIVRYELMFPKGYASKSIQDITELKKYVKEQNPPVLGLSFGIKRPVTLVAQYQGKTKIKHFGDGSYIHHILTMRQRRAKVCKILAKRYANRKWYRNKQRRKYFDRLGDKEYNWIKTNTHILTKEICVYIKQNYPGAVVIMQEPKGLKKISYPPEYRYILNAWNISMQEHMINYKSMLRDNHIHFIPYKQSNDLICPCGYKYQENKKPIKILTCKLLHGINRKAYWTARVQELTRIMQKQMRPAIKTPEIIKHIQLTSEKLTYAKEKLKIESEKNTFKLLHCPKCNKNSDFYIADAQNLCSLFRKEVEA